MFCRRHILPSFAVGLVALFSLGAPLQAQSSGATALQSAIDRKAGEINAKVVAWRRDIHEHPELSFQEVRTAKLVALRRVLEGR